MCGRFTLTQSGETIVRAFNIARLNESMHSRRGNPPWLPQFNGVGTGALPLHIYTNDSDALYK